MYKISVNGEKFISERDVAIAVAKLEKALSGLSCKVDAFVVKNSVQLLINKLFSDVITEEKYQKNENNNR